MTADALTQDAKCCITTGNRATEGKNFKPRFQIPVGSGITGRRLSDVILLPPHASLAPADERMTPHAQDATLPIESTRTIKAPETAPRDYYTPHLQAVLGVDKHGNQFDRSVTPIQEGSRDHDCDLLCGGVRIGERKDISRFL